MPDNFNSAYLATRQDRNKAEMDKALAEADAVLASQPKPATPTSAPTAPKKEASPGVLTEGVKAVAGGVTDAVRNSWNLIDDAATWLDNNLLDLRISSSTFGAVGGAKAAGNAHKEDLQVPELVSPNKTTTGQVARSITQFVVPFIGATKALRAANVLQGASKATVAAKGMAAGAAVDMAAFDPSEKRLSNLIMDVTDGNPALGKPIFEYLAADPNDSHLEGRVKNTLEGLGLGIATEGLIKGLKATRAHFSAKGKDPVQAVQEAAQSAPEDLTAHAVDTAKPADMRLADQIDLLTGVKREGPNKFQKALDMKAALADADAKATEAAAPKGLDLAEGSLPTTRKEGNPDAFLNKGSQETKLSLQDPNGIPYEVPTKAGGEVSFPDAWKLVEHDPEPRKVFLDTQDGHLVMGKEAAGPHQLDLDLGLEDALKATEKTPEQKTLLEGYKELQEKVLERVPQEAEAPTKAASKDLEERIAAAQARVEAAMESGKGLETAQRVLDGLLKKKDAGLFDHSSKLGKKEAEKLASNGDPLVDAIAANNERLLAAFGKKQGGTISPSMLANLASMQAGAVTGYLSAEDDATFAERLSMAGVGAFAGLGVKVGATKVLKPAERAVLDNPDPVAKALSREGMENIAPLTERMAAKKPAPVIHMDKVKSIVQAAREGRLGEVAATASKDSINFARIDTPEDVNELFQAVQGTFQKELEKSAGGAIRTHDIVAQNAELTGTGLKSLEERYQSLANLDSHILADRHLLAASGEKTMEMIRRAVETGDDFAVLAAEKQAKLHAVIQAKVKANTTELARALAAHRIEASSADLAINEASALLESMGGKAAKLDYFKQILEMPTEGGRNQAMRMGFGARTRDALTEASVMGKLWAPTTHMANLIGNSLAAVGGAAEKATASMIGKFITRSSDAITLAEAKAHVFGMMDGIKDALEITAQGRQALKDAAGKALSGDLKGAKGVLADNIEEFGDSYRAAALDAPVGRSTMDRTIDAGRGSQVNAISAEAFDLDAEKPLGALVDALGTLNRLPGRALGASDELFWAINYRGELKAQAYRTARQEGLEGDSLVNRVAELVQEPPQDLRALAVQAAQKGTFTEPLMGNAAAFQKMVDDFNIGHIPAGRMLVPFIKTPYNIFKYGAERTPLLNYFTDAWKADMAAGGARRDLAYARVVLGGTLMASAMYLQTGAKIAGQDVQVLGGGDYNQSSEKLNGEMQYALKIGDRYYTYNRLDPLGMFIGLGADIRDISGHLDDTTLRGLAAASAMAISRNMASKSYLAGLIDFITSFSKAVSGDPKQLTRFLNNEAGSLIPASSLWNTIRKADDPLAREVWDLVDSIKNKLPGYSKDLPPKRNVFGEPIKLDEGLGSDIVSPIRTSQADTDPLASEIARLNIDLKQPPKTLFTAPGAPGIDLSPQQYDKLVQHSGEFFKTELGKLIASDSYKSLPENPDNSIYMEGKEKVIRDLHTHAKLAGTRKLLAEDPELAAQWYADRRNAGAALKGQPILPF